MKNTLSHNEKAESLNGRLAMLGVIAALGAYAVTGQIIPWYLVMAKKNVSLKMGTHKSRSGGLTAKGRAKYVIERQVLT